MPSQQEPKDGGSGSIAIDEAPSIALLPVSVPALLLVCAPGEDLDRVLAECLKLGFRPVHFPRIELAPKVEDAPQYCLVEPSLPGAIAYLQSLFKAPGPRFVVALVGTGADLTEAYHLGANTVVHRPMNPSVLAAVLAGNKRRTLQLQQTEVVVEHDRRVTAANAFEGLLRALGQDVRNPLATALANMEYLSEVGTKGSPLTTEEHTSVVDDSLSSLRQIRLVLESVSALIPRDPPLLSQLRLWAVAQRVIDELPAASAQVSLMGDSEVLGWGDETTLVEVTSALVRRAITGPGAANGTPSVSIHVYAHDTEARITVHDSSTHVGTPSSGDPFHPSLTLGEPGQSGLLLTAARHAMVRMGGTLAYVPRTKSGCAFRMRLRIAQPNDS